LTVEGGRDDSPIGLSLREARESPCASAGVPGCAGRKFFCVVGAEFVANISPRARR